MSLVEIEAGQKVMQDGKECQVASKQSEKQSFSPPEDAQTAAKRALEWRREFERGMTNVGVARARDLANGKNLSAETIKRMRSFFARHGVNREKHFKFKDGEPTTWRIAWDGWGGDSGRRWVESIKLDEEKSMKEITVLVADDKEQAESWEQDFIADLEDSVKAVTKRVGDQDLPASAFLVVEDPEQVTTWHLPVKNTDGTADRRRMGAAHAALLDPKGYRGKKYAGPNKEEAISKLRKLYESEDMSVPGTKQRGEGQGVGSERQGDGGAGVCVCPECDYEVNHKRGTPCAETKCPECGVALIGKSDEGNKAGRRVRGDKVNVLKELASRFNDVKDAFEKFIGWAGYDDEKEPEAQEEGFLSWLESNAATKALEDAEQHGSSFVAFKAADGRDWLLTFSTNAFEDREGEIFATKAIEEYVARHENDKTKGEYQFWHLPGSKFGDIKWQGTAGRFLVEAGPFDNTPTGRAFKAFFAKNPSGHSVVAPDGWGCSHKYEYRSKDREDGVYDWFEKSETTILPLDAAANEHTAPVFLGKELVEMNERQQNALELIGGKDLVKMVETVGQKATENLEQTVNFKSGDPAAIIRQVAEATEDEAVKAQLTNIASEMDNSQESEKEQAEDEKQAGPALGKRLAMLAGQVKGPAAAELRKIASSLMGGDEKMEMEDDEKPPEKSKEMDEFTEAVGEGFKAVIESYKAENTEIATALTALANAVKGIQEEIQALSRTDEEKIAEKAADTPAASLREIVGRAIGDPSTRVDGRKTYAKDGPKQAQPVIDGQTGIPLIDTYVSGADQRQLGR